MHWVKAGADMMRILLFVRDVAKKWGEDTVS